MAENSVVFVRLYVSLSRGEIVYGIAYEVKASVRYIDSLSSGEVKPGKRLRAYRLALLRRSCLLS